VTALDPKLEKLEAAKRDLSLAEQAIERLLREIPVVARAEKTRASAAVEGAFSRLRAAQSDLADLEKLLRAEATLSHE
jgi:hypothetical protein